MENAASRAAELPGFQRLLPVSVSPPGQPCCNQPVHGWQPAHRQGARPLPHVRRRLPSTAHQPSQAMVEPSRLADPECIVLKIPSLAACPTLFSARCLLPDNSFLRQLCFRLLPHPQPPSSSSYLPQSQGFHLPVVATVSSAALSYLLLWNAYHHTTRNGEFSC